MIINNENKFCRAFDQLLKSETPLNYVHYTRLGLTMLAYPIIRAPAEARSQDLPVPRSALPLSHRPHNQINLDYIYSPI